MSCIYPHPKDIYPRRELNTATKVQQFFDICKFFLHIARNQHEIVENIYKEDRKNCYTGSSFQFVRRVTHFQLEQCHCTNSVLRHGWDGIYAIAICNIKFNGSFNSS